MTTFRKLWIGLATATLATGAAVAACYNDVPGPQGPLPSPTREVPPQGPKPGPVMPTPPLLPTQLDAALPTPQGATSSTSQAATSSTSRGVRLTIPTGVALADPPKDAGTAPTPPTPIDASPAPAPTPQDAGIDSTADLPPEVPDAGRIVQPDAGQPLHR